MMKVTFTLVVILYSLFSYAQRWYFDLDEAKTLADQKDRKIIMVFQGSDWCAPCIKLNKEIWSTDEFITYADDHFILVKVDFPRKKQNALSLIQQENNNQLAEIYNIHGYFPFVVVMDKTGKVLGETGYKKMKPFEYIDLLESFKG